MTRTRTHAIVMIIGFAMIMTACSPQRDSTRVATLDPVSSQDSVTGQADIVAETEEAMLAYTQCLRDQGIDIGDPTVNADGSLALPPIELTVEDDGSGHDDIDFSELEELIAPCEELLSGVAILGSGASDSAFEDAMVEYTRCIRDNDVDMPDPDFSAEGRVVDLGPLDEDAFEAADAVCRSVFESFSASD